MSQKTDENINNQSTKADLQTQKAALDSNKNQQERALEHMREYINNMQDEGKWDKSFSKTQNQLAAAAQQARKEIAEGKSQPMDIRQL